MTKVSANVWDYLEVPSRQERDSMAEQSTLWSIRILPSELGFTVNEEDFFQERSKIADCLVAIEQKLFDTVISYVMTMHYYRKGIPDVPKDQPHKTPQEREEYIKTTAEDYCNRYWFGYYTDLFYIHIQTIWDIAIELINYYFEYNYANDSRLVSNLYRRLKKDHIGIAGFLDQIRCSELYTKSKGFRTNAAHFVPSINTKRVDKKTDIDGEITDVLTDTYDKPSEIVGHIIEYISFCKKSIHQLMRLAKNAKSSMQELLENER